MDGECSTIRRPSCTRKTNIKMELKYTECKNVDWIHLAQDDNQWRDLLNRTSLSSTAARRIGLGCD
jgi:hypothetical protein